MKTKQILAGVVALGALALGTQAAQAATVCTSCEYGGSAGTYIGTHNPGTLDKSVFNHSDLGDEMGPSTAFEDFWVFDLSPGGDGSISADFTMFTAIAGFTGELYHDGGSVCAGAPAAPGDCGAVATAGLIASVVAVDGRWEILANDLAAGRYVIRVSGTTNAINGSSSSAYSGQLAFIPDAVPEPGTLALLGLGLVGIGLTVRRRKV